MKKVALYVCAAVLAVPAFAADHITPGKWKVTTEMQMVGMDMKMPANTMERCITKEEAENPEKSIAKGPRDASDCKIVDMKNDGGHVTWKMTCEKEQVKAEGDIKYEENSYKGTLHMVAQGHEMNMKMSAERVGDCSK